MSKTLRSKALVAIPSLAAAAPDRLPLAFALRDLAVAPENLRFGEPADAGIGELAETILAAGVLQPLTVRPGRDPEPAAMVLDGRRRLLALASLLETGRIDDGYLVSCFVETDVARQAAASVLTNTAVPVHLADVIAAIGKMLKAKLTVTAIAGALGYGETDIRRLAALSELHPTALEALKAGRCSLRQAKLLARLPDPQLQGEIAEAALGGFGFQEWRVTERLDAGQVTVHDRRFGLVGRERYAAAGGRIESDLFGERADVLLDPDRLQAAWRERAHALAETLRDAERTVSVEVEAADIEDGPLEPFGDAYGVGLEGEDLAAWRRAASEARDAQAALAGCDLSDPGADTAIVAYLAARVAADRAAEPHRQVSRLVVFADAEAGLDVRAWGPPEPGLEAEADPAVGQIEVADAGDEIGDRIARPDRPGAADPAPLAVAPAAEVAGVNHALHELRTDVATRALIRALADDPSAALIAVVARLFSVLVLHQGVGRGGGALSLGAAPYSRPRTPPIPALDGDVRRRLAERRAAWADSGLSPIAWVTGLKDETRLTLLAELAGLSLDLREERTTSVRSGARGEATEIAALCGADVTRHWTPGPAFLAAHPKGKLLRMLDEMGAQEPLAAGARKDELVALVAERAAERGWAPAYLSWASEPPAAGDDEDPSPDTPAPAGAPMEPETAASEGDEGTPLAA